MGLIAQTTISREFASGAVGVLHSFAGAEAGAAVAGAGPYADAVVAWADSISATDRPAGIDAIVGPTGLQRNEQRNSAREERVGPAEGMHLRGRVGAVCAFRPWIGDTGDEISDAATPNPIDP